MHTTYLPIHCQTLVLYKVTYLWWLWSAVRSYETHIETFIDCMLTSIYWHKGSRYTSIYEPANLITLRGWHTTHSHKATQRSQESLNQEKQIVPFTITCIWIVLLLQRNALFYHERQTEHFKMIYKWTIL